MRRAALAAALGLAVHGAALAQTAPQTDAQADPQPAPPTPGEPPAAASCITHVEGAKAPAYPQSAMRAHRFGRVQASLHFDAPDRAPVVELLHRPRAEPLAAAVRTWAQGLRMPCHAGERQTVKQTHRFFFEGENPGFRALRVPELLALARPRQERRPFDTTGMPCPVQVAWTYYQPQRLNEVRVEGEAHPAHAPLLERLARLELALSPAADDMAWGATARFEIPCHPPESVNKE